MAIDEKDIAKFRDLPVTTVPQGISGRMRPVYHETRRVGSDIVSHVLVGYEPVAEEPRDFRNDEWS